MRKTWFITIFIIIYLAFFLENYLYLSRNRAKETSIMPIDNYIDISHRTQNLAEEEKSYIERKKSMYPKEVFLTFDDGPSINNTVAILNILKSNNVKATFFVIGSKAQQYPQIIKELNDSGMCVMPHSYTHDYKIYKNISSYFQDLEACCSVIEEVTGNKNKLYVRLPGGSSNGKSNKLQKQNIRNELKKRYIYYVDWNVSAADAASERVSMERIKENVINQCRGKRLAVVLMHDSSVKTTSAKALPYIINYLKKEGFEFRTFHDITPDEERLMIKEGIINR